LSLTRRERMKVLALERQRVMHEMEGAIDNAEATVRGKKNMAEVLENISIMDRDIAEQEKLADQAIGTEGEDAAWARLHNLQKERHNADKSLSRLIERVERWEQDQAEAVREMHKHS
jgi:putative NADH-flavin reductase